MDKVYLQEPQSPNRMSETEAMATIAKYEMALQSIIIMCSHIAGTSVGAITKVCQKALERDEQ